MAHRRVRIDVGHSVQRERAPLRAFALPVQRRLPAARRRDVEALREPQLGPPIPAVGDERGEFAVRDRRRRQIEGRDVDAMRGAFVVEREAVAVVAERHEAAVEAMPRVRPGRDGRERPARVIDGPRRVAREEMLDVGEQEFLVLLLVMQAEFGQRRRVRVQRPLEEALHRRVDVPAVRQHGREVGTRQQAALGAGMPVADAVVVRVEQHAERRVERTVPGRVRREHERLEEPGHVRKVPLGRARVGHRLQRTVFRRQRRREELGLLADGRERRREVGVAARRALRGGMAGMALDGGHAHLLRGGPGSRLRYHSPRGGATGTTGTRTGRGRRRRAARPACRTCGTEVRRDRRRGSDTRRTARRRPGPRARPRGRW